MAQQLTLEDLNEQQRVAVNTCLDMTKRIAAVTGEAGTGKTSIIRIVYNSLVEAGYNPVIAAPTGKAAKRIREATEAPAMTLHMLLKYTRPGDIDEKTGKPVGSSYPRHDKEMPIEYDHVLVDEYAMTNQELHRNLIDAMPSGCRLLVFGDVSQLPPIETVPKYAAMTTPFKAALERFNGVKLEQVHRQSEDSMVLLNAQRINNGLGPKQGSADFIVTITEKPVEAVINAVIEAGDAFATLSNQVITPTNTSWIGTAALNQQLQMMLMPAGRKLLELSRHKWAKTPLAIGAGDKVMMTKNYYDLEADDGTVGLFNGEVGIVQEIGEYEEVIVDFDGRIISVPPAIQVAFDSRTAVVYPQRDLELAYCITTHKAQGSEYQHVLYVMSKAAQFNLNRKNFYTAVSRARQKVTLVTDMKAMGLALSTKEQRILPPKPTKVGWL
jgi:exodeoxyribonuclease V alpha subunit